MKLQLNFDEKVINLETEIELGKLFDTIQHLLPDWKEWKIQSIYVHSTYPQYPVWYIDPWYTQWKYWNPSTTGMNSDPCHASVGTEELNYKNGEVSKIKRFLEMDENNNCHFNVNTMTGIHEVLISSK